MILREQKQYYKQAVPGTANPARVKLLQSCSLSPRTAANLCHNRKQQRTLTST